MTTEQFYVQVAEHFLTNYKPGDTARAVFERYAKEEFGWGEARAKKFAEKAEKGRAVEALIKAQKRFYLWYKLNYMKDVAIVEDPGTPTDPQTD
ncbi:hypothetical protein A3860_17520 [Niastella vici]|uniref:Uncharacterized protein n=1 Tax=Niastella vici TaxID=1703345 RepID=A0A1V9G4I9_9BACT|nr:hypothetical protein [Niastella vici]OQP65464.1 hypothetical protein A3860_17520 [Niastella vici]